MASDGKKRKRLSNALVSCRHRSLRSILAPTLGQLSRKVEECLRSAAFTEVGVVCPAVMSIQALNANALIAPVAAAAAIIADLTMAVNAIGAKPGHAASEIAAAWQPSRCTVAWAVHAGEIQGDIHGFRPGATLRSGSGCEWRHPLFWLQFALRSSECLQHIA